MTDEAAFRATFCNLKNIAGRKVMQVICEVPVEQADVVLDALGWPDPANPRWVAIALLKDAQ
jgi:hypothetical protein